MSHGIVSLLTLCAALGCGLVAGVFFAFSSFVMPALSRLAAPQGIAAMQSINVAVLNRWFLGALLGTAVTCALLAAGSLVSWQQRGAWLRVAACALYLVGTMVVTIACSVPHNRVLAAVAADSAEGAALWPSYVARWTTWNHMRAAAALAAAALLTMTYRLTACWAR